MNKNPNGKSIFKYLISHWVLIFTINISYIVFLLFTLDIFQKILLFCQMVSYLLDHTDLCAQRLE